MRALTRILFVIFISPLLTSCGLTPREVKYDDNEVQPLWTAISNVTRDTLGFTPIDKNADIRLEGRSILFDKPYDLMLHIYGTTSRIIAFKKIDDDKFVWVGEQEIFKGPRKYKTVDGEFNEEIILTYDIEPISGHPLNQLSVDYNGPDEGLMTNRNLRLDDIRPMIKDWTDRH
jgi:hypothetical protein